MNENERLLVEANLQRRNAHKDRLSRTETPYAPRSYARDDTAHYTRTMGTHHSTPDSLNARNQRNNDCSVNTIAPNAYEGPTCQHRKQTEKTACALRQNDQTHPHAVVDRSGHLHKSHPSFFASCKHALDGLHLCLTTERNFKIMLVIALILQVVCLITPWMNENLYLLITLYSVIMLVLELINTAVETVVDLASPAYHPLAKRAKDIMAGAVWFFALACIHLGIIGFVRPLIDMLFHN